MEKDIQQLRQEIDAIDVQMAELFCKRMDIVKYIIYGKIKNNKEIYDAKREKAMLAQRLENLPNPALNAEYEEFLKAVLVISKNYQEKIAGETQIK